ncbi:hypothetical protein ACEN3O_01530 [Leuconostoc mesenteroides]|uniref:hypothetical protein n=1 Tax=Leuconostoc mesenteroides TaxID=1245 RepID=UPI0021A800D5|nr:hypothetical protein [Leuconostoc mesenteroides]
MKKTFTLEEVISIINEIHAWDFEHPIKEYAELNSFNKEEAVYYATDEYVDRRGWRK